MLSFWKTVDREWSLLCSILAHHYNFKQPARLIVNDEGSAETEYTIEEDIYLCRIHRSPRLRTYLLKAADDCHDLIDRLLRYQDSQTVRAGGHPLPA